MIMILAGVVVFTVIFSIIMLVGGCWLKYQRTMVMTLFYFLYRPVVQRKLEKLGYQALVFHIKPGSNVTDPTAVLWTLKVPGDSMAYLVTTATMLRLIKTRKFQEIPRYCIRHGTMVSVGNPKLYKLNQISIAGRLWEHT